MKIFDAHTHIFPAEIAADRSACLSDSGFNSIYSSEKAELITCDELLKAMDQHDIEYSAAAGFSWENAEFRKKHNDYLAESGYKSGGRIIPLKSFSAFSDEDTSSISRLKSEGFAGIGEISFYNRCFGDAEKEGLQNILKESSEAGVPVMIHVSEPVGHEYPGKRGGPFSELIELIASNPKAVIVLAHWGGGLIFYELMPEINAAFKNVYYDTAATPFLYNEKIYAAALNIVSSEKILFGSDYPLLKPERYIESIVQKIGPGEAENILYNNSSRIFRKG